VSPKKGEVIADIGCAEGRWTYEFKKRGASSFGLDVVPCPPTARKMGINFIQGDIFQLAFKNSSLDKVFISEVLIGLNDIPAALDEVHRVLKPNGKFILLNSRGYEITEKFFSSDRSYFSIGRGFLTKLAKLKSPNWQELKILVLRKLGVHEKYERNLQIEESVSLLQKTGFTEISVKLTLNRIFSDVMGLLIITKIILAYHRFPKMSTWNFWKLYPLFWVLERISTQPGLGVIYISKKRYNTKVTP
jgi:ubiquinone/menaquinone biosynthesis C-methylase UbiE